MVSDMMVLSRQVLRQKLLEALIDPALEIVIICRQGNPFISIDPILELPV